MECKNYIHKYKCDDYIRNGHNCNGCNLQITNEFDRGYYQALTQVLAEARVRCHRAKKDCQYCVNNGITCNTYEAVKRVKDLADSGF